MNDQWYLWNYSEERPDGPFTTQEIERMARDGMITPDSSLAWGNTQDWKPAGSYAGLFASNAQPYVQPHGGLAGHSQVQFAGFWIRFVAYVIDGIILGVVGGAIEGGLRAAGFRFANPEMFDFSAKPDVHAAWFEEGDILALILGTAVGIAYFAGMHASERGATLGKMVVGLRVVDSKGGRISPARGIGRYFGTWLSGITLAIGYIMAGFHPQKRALHDVLADTYVIYDKRSKRV